MGIHDKKHLQKIVNSMTKLRACKELTDETYWVPTRLQPQPTKEEYDQLHFDIDSWTEQIKQTDVELLNTGPEPEGADEDESLPPVRGASKSGFVTA